MLPFWQLLTKLPLPNDLKSCPMWVYMWLQTEHDFTEKCTLSVGEESVDSQLIASPGSLNQLYGSLTVSVTTPFIKLNNSTRENERSHGEKEEG